MSQGTGRLLAPQHADETSLAAGDSSFDELSRYNKAENSPLKAGSRDVIGSPLEFSSPVPTSVFCQRFNSHHGSIYSTSVGGEPSSRGGSPTPDAVLGSSRGHSPAATRSFMVEKEVIESQLRKLEVENSSLRKENKLLKEKYNRAMSRCESLEKQLMAMSSEANHQNTEHHYQVAHLKTISQYDHDALQQRNIELTKQVEILRAENSSLQTEVTEMRMKKIHGDSSDRARIIHGYKTQNDLLKEELREVKELLAGSEKAAALEIEMRKEASSQVVRLTEMKTLLQQQLEEGGANSVLEKQLKSVETRLRVTEERLHQERADRSAKLSQVEEKLINENAKLQVSEKELKKQLTREQQKTKNLENKVREARDQPAIDKMPKDDPAVLQRQVTMLKEQVDDLNSEKKQIHERLSQEVSTAIEDKHSMSSRLKMLEDLNAGLRAENAALSHYNRPEDDTNATLQHLEQLKTWQAKIAASKSEATEARSEASGLARQNALLDAELRSARGQLAATHTSLDDALAQLASVVGNGAGGDDTGLDRSNLQALRAQIKGLEAEVELWRRKYTEVSEKYQLEVPEMVTATRASMQQQLPPQEKTVPESEKLELENELKEKDTELVEVRGRYNEVENQLQRTKQQLLRQHQQEESAAKELATLQAEVRQLKREAGRWASKEADVQTQLHVTRENLVQTNTQLTDKSAQLKLAKSDNKVSEEKLQKVTSDLSERDRQLSLDIAQAIASGQIKTVLYSETAKTATEVLAQADLKVRTLEQQLDDQKFEVQHRSNELESVVHEQVEVEANARQARQELLKETSRVTLLTADNQKLQQQLEASEEEVGVLSRQRATMEQQKVRQEVAAAQLTDKLQDDRLLEEEVKALEATLEELGPHGHKVAVELATTRRLLEAREHEISLLNDTIQLQKVENDGLNRKCQVLREEIQANRDDMENLTEQLTNTMKEYSTLSEDHQKIMRDRDQQESRAGREHSMVQKTNTEIAALRAKLDGYEERIQHFQDEIRDRSTSLAQKEAALEHVEKYAQQSEAERKEAREHVRRLSDDLRRLNDTNVKLEAQLEGTASNLNHEKSTRADLREQLADKNRELDILKHEHQHLKQQLFEEQNRMNSLQVERESLDELRTQNTEQMRRLQQEVDSLQRNLNDSHTQIQTVRTDKESLHGEVQELLRKVAERDQKMTSLQHEHHSHRDTVKKEFVQEKVMLIEETHRLQDQLTKTREEMEDVKEKLREKELHLMSTYRTNRDLEEVAKVREELEEKLLELEGEMNEARHNITTLSMDKERLAEANLSAQESLEQLRASNVSFKEQLREQRERLTGELQAAENQLRNEQRHADTAQMQLQEELNRTISQLKASEVSLTAANQTKEKHQVSIRQLEKQVDDMKTTLHEEVTMRKLAEQRIETLNQQMAEYNKNKSVESVHAAELKSQISRLTSELSLQKEKYRKMKQDYTDIQSMCYAHEANNHSLNTQVNELTHEVSTLRGAAEQYRQKSEGHQERLELEIRQMRSNHDSERSRMLDQISQLGNDLDIANNSLAAKGREALSLQERVLSLEAGSREAEEELSVLKQSARQEADTRVHLDSRNMELELLLAKLRTKDEAGDYDQTRSEVSRMMAELSRRVQEQVDSVRNSDAEARAADAKKLQLLKTKITGLESRLSQEQALHIVTRNQLRSVEEDNNRLRAQLTANRRRHMQPEANSRNKTRIEEINEIIARSQAQAQHLLEASGHPTTPRYHTTASSVSPDVSFASDDLRLNLKA